MDSRMRQSLDNYITSGRYSESVEELTCKSCGYKWEVGLFTEYGMTSYKSEEDAVCPECGCGEEE